MQSGCSSARLPTLMRPATGQLVRGRRQEKYEAVATGGGEGEGTGAQLAFDVVFVLSAISSSSSTFEPRSPAPTMPPLLRALLSWLLTLVQRLLLAIDDAANVPVKPSSKVETTEPHLEPKAIDSLPKQPFAANGASLALTAIDLNVATMAYGTNNKASVRWDFLGSQSRWGRIGGSPAAVLLFEFTFDHPDGYELEVAEFDLTFDAVDDKYISPQVRACAPVDFQGLGHEESRSSRWQFLPEISAGGGGGGGIGGEKSKALTVKRRCWGMHSVRDRAAGRDSGELTRVKWTYKACTVAPGDHRPVSTRVGIVVDFWLVDPTCATPSNRLFHDATFNLVITGKLSSALKKLKFGSHLTGNPQPPFKVEKRADCGDLKSAFHVFEEDVQKNNLIGKTAAQ